ncbi:MFS hexose transporter [Aureobasidium sp. EXF-8845]|nr:MFS hexose transporter [Aureobasidium sp. EXF-8845]KAI4856813.1 MFS hexose transporter [Aureobasidium sp. EXF-8846]
MDTKAASIKQSIELREHDIGKSSSLTGAEKTNHVRYAYQEESVWSALKSNWRALLCTIYMLYNCVTYGYDGVAGTVVINLPQFRKDFGTPYGKQYIIPASWQLAWNEASLVGLVVGGIISGMLAEKKGKRYTLAIALVIQVGGTFAQYFAVGARVVFLVGKLITGLPLGAYQTLGPAYVSEIMPLKLRGPTTAATVFAITFGQFLSYVAIRVVTFTPGSKAYQTMFAVQWGLAAVSFVCLYFIPESPYYFISHGKIENARNSITKLYGDHTDVEGRVSDIMAALRLDSEGDTTSSGLAACFSKQHRRRTIITCGAFIIASQSGSTWVIGFVGYFLQLAGKTAAQANGLSLVILGMTLVGNVCGWPLIEMCGRRPVMLWGLLLLIGILGSVVSASALNAQIVFMALWAVVFPATVGGVVWPIATELPASSVRAATLGLCIMCNGFGIAIWAFVLPFLVNPDEANMGGKVGFIFGALMACSAVYTFFLVPETKGRSYTEIDELFERRVSLRKFQKTDLHFEDL